MFAMYPFDYNCGNDYFGVLPTYGRPTRKNPWTRRNEAYYSPTHVDLANLRELQRCRAEEGAQERRLQQQQLQEERRRRLARERAYRQWLADRERERSVFGSPFGRRPFDYDDYVSDDDDVGSEVDSVAQNTPGKRETSEPAPMPAVRKLDPDEAARRIARFLRRSTGKLRMTRILAKLRDLRALENRLGELYAQQAPIGQLTFDDERPRKVLPVSADNKAYLGYEEAILRTLDELDRVQSEGAELVRDLRRAIVGRAQHMLDDLDAECDRQWTEHSQRLTKEAEENISETHESQTETTVVSAEQNNDNELERKHDSNQAPAVDVEEGNEITDANDVIVVAESADESAATDSLVELSLPEQEISSEDSTTRAKVESDSNSTQLHELSVAPMEQISEGVEIDGGDDMVEVTMRDAEDDQTHREEDDFIVVDNPLGA